MPLLNKNADFGLLARVLSDPNGPGMGYANAMAEQQQRQQGLLAQRLQELQMQQVEQNMKRQREANQKYAGLLSNPDGFIDQQTASLLSQLPPEMGQQLLSKVIESRFTPKELPAEIQAMQIYQQYPELLDIKKSITSAGAPNNKIEVKTGESIASQVGPIVKGTYDGAVAGAKLVDSSQRILMAIDKGGAIVGPTANLRLKGAQIADLLGVGGSDNAEKIANTRAIIRATAEQAVAARSMLGGQAQISNAEQELITKATAGDISDLTISELAQIAKISDKLGRQMYSAHQEKLNVMKSDPNMGGIYQYYMPPPISPEYQGSQPKQEDKSMPPPGAVRRMK